MSIVCFSLACSDLRPDSMKGSGLSACYYSAEHSPASTLP